MVANIMDNIYDNCLENVEVSESDFDIDDFDEVFEDIEKVLSEINWTISKPVDINLNGINFVELRAVSPLGENIVESVYFLKTTTSFVSFVRQMAEEFDPEGHASINAVRYADKFGTPCPSSVTYALIKDSAEIKDMYLQLANTLNEWFDTAYRSHYTFGSF